MQSEESLEDITRQEDGDGGNARPLTSAMESVGNTPVEGAQQDDRTLDNQVHRDGVQMAPSGTDAVTLGGGDTARLPAEVDRTQFNANQQEVRLAMH